ncbi:hypothetical protein PGSY75_1435500 [Plasmodium gaboni]|uniref:Clathrin light chain n=1 Tax=Plasmodium gaboni TaxID=647221 RepID=A0A151LAG3_9APIC|nr:hypothetical protein PGSY75_1435500 [Plasmodium gaboni]KYN95950.1 hypothetical protein PGSY75_1435500 [Plasmodium gaboni]
MSELKEFDEFNFKNYDNYNNNEKENDQIPSNILYEENNEVRASLDKLNYMNPIENVDYNNMNMSSNNFYNELNKRESASSLLYNNNNNNNMNNMNNINNNLNNKYNGSDIKNHDSFYKSNLSSPMKENRMSFENSYETFFEKESDISDTEVSDVWEKERLQRIKERKEYEEKEKKEIKKKAAQDLKKWYEEIAIVIEEKKKLSNQKLSEDKKKEQNFDNKTWLKVSQYLDMEKGEYFKENSRMKQVLLKLIQKESS